MGLAIFSLIAAAAAPAPLADDPFGWMDELAGACWSAAYPDGTRDTQCYRLQYDLFLRGTIAVAGGGSRPPYRGDSVATWDPSQRAIRFTYWGSLGNHGSLVGHVEGEHIVFPGPATPEGAATRTVWTRLGADSFRVVQQRQAGEGWADALTLTYARDRAAAPAAD